MRNQVGVGPCTGQDMPAETRVLGVGMMNSVYILFASGQRGSVRSNWVIESGLSGLSQITKKYPLT